MQAFKYIICLGTIGLIIAIYLSVVETAGEKGKKRSKTNKRSGQSKVYDCPIETRSRNSSSVSDLSTCAGSSCDLTDISSIESKGEVNQLEKPKGPIPKKASFFSKIFGGKKKEQKSSAESAETSSTSKKRPSPGSSSSPQRKYGKILTSSDESVSDYAPSRARSERGATKRTKSVKSNRAASVILPKQEAKDVVTRKKKRKLPSDEEPSTSQSKKVFAPSKPSKVLKVEKVHLPAEKRVSPKKSDAKTQTPPYPAEFPPCVTEIIKLHKDCTKFWCKASADEIPSTSTGVKHRKKSERMPQKEQSSSEESSDSETAQTRRTGSLARAPTPPPLPSLKDKKSEGKKKAEEKPQPPTEKVNISLLILKHLEAQEKEKRIKTRAPESLSFSDKREILERKLGSVKSSTHGKDKKKTTESKETNTKSQKRKQDEEEETESDEKERKRKQKKDKSQKSTRAKKLCYSSSTEISD